jgi:hypothetical protein
MIDRSQRIVDAYCRGVAVRLKRNPNAVLSKARENLDRMRPHSHPELVSEWERAISRPIDRIAMLLTGPRGAGLRRNHPFAGVLSEAERRRILRNVRREARRA